MKRRRLLLALCPLILGLIAPAHSAEAAWPAAAAVRDPASLMNPLLGTSHDGNTFPGADTHFGMSQWGPGTPARPPGGFYAYSDNVATGFSLNHIPGPGCRAMGEIPLLPTIGAVDGNASGGFSHSAEKASAGAYAVDLWARRPAAPLQDREKHNGGHDSRAGLDGGAESGDRPDRGLLRTL